MVFVGAQNIAQLCAQFCWYLVAHKEAIQLAGEVVGRYGLFQDDVDDLHAIERAVFAQEVFVAAVVAFVVDDELGSREIPTRERARPFADIRFGIVADTHGE